MAPFNRRDALKALSVSAAMGCEAAASQESRSEPQSKSIDPGAIRIDPLGFPWKTQDPFLFCVYHDDAYPKGNTALGPAASLAGRNLGNDFSGKDGWRMYHGDVVPGFPRHPHRGFETITIVRSGLVDHSDSMGAVGRYGGGDIQWMTAGKGIQHAELFPLLRKDADNPLELFQIWLNLPKRSKMVPAHFRMLWREQIKTMVFADDDGLKSEVTVMAGRLGSELAPPPPPGSWAADPDNAVAIYTIRLEPKAVLVLPEVAPSVGRTLYGVSGGEYHLGPKTVPAGHRATIDGVAAVRIANGASPVELLLLQGRPINEPVVHHGPFVMNTRDEIHEAIVDYQSTQFGGWPHASDAPVHPRAQPRFARHADGKTEKPT